MLLGASHLNSVESQVGQEAARCERGWGGGAGVPGRQLGSCGGQESEGAQLGRVCRVRREMQTETQVEVRASWWAWDNSSAGSQEAEAES